MPWLGYSNAFGGQMTVEIVPVILVRVMPSKLFLSSSRNHQIMPNSVIAIQL
jgi:hypothetical protein